MGTVLPVLSHTLPIPRPGADDSTRRAPANLVLRVRRSYLLAEALSFPHPLLPRARTELGEQSWRRRRASFSPPRFNAPQPEPGRTLPRPKIGPCAAGLH